MISDKPNKNFIKNELKFRFHQLKFRKKKMQKRVDLSLTETKREAFVLPFLLIFYKIV